MMMNAQKGEEFRKYRDIAPEGVEDATIINLIQKSGGNHSAISAAIENMWHDDEKAVGVRDEWNTTSKSKAKKDAIASNQGNDRGGRGGRGRSMPPAGGRGQGSGGRGDRVSGRGAGPPPGRGSSISRPAAPAAPVQNQSPAQQSVAVSEQVAPAPTPAASNGATGWGWGGPTSLAEKLKQAEIQKHLPPPAPVVQIVREETPVDVVEVQAEEEEEEEEEVAVVITVEDDAAALEQVAELSINETVVVEEVKEEVRVEPIVAPVPQSVPVTPASIPEVSREREITAQVQEMVQESAPKAFLKMGKWEAPMESSAFQFGSFGNFVNSSSEDSISLSTPAPWGGVAESSEQQGLESASGVWGAATNSADVSSSSSSSGPSPMSSLFPAPKGLPSVPSDSTSGVSSSSQNQGGRYDQQKPSAPPGLDPHPHSGMSKPLPIPRQDSRTAPPGQNQSRGKHEANQQLQQQQLQQQQYQPQYQQPAAAPAAPVRGNAPVASSIPYGYAPGFELQPQYPPYQPAPVMPPPAAGSSPVAATGAPSTQQASVSAPQGQQGQGQLQYGPPPGMPGHYGNPYYGPYYNPGYFYGQPQVQNPYYGQGRDYQASRPYVADPYAPGVQYPVYQQGGGFPDASGSYPNMPMQQQHPSMGPQGQGAAAAPGAPAAGGQGQGKQQKGAGASSAAPQQQQQDPNQGYGYNPYNPRDAQWQYQQSAQGWGAPMMGFPGGPGQSPPGAQGFSQQPPQSAGQGQRPSASYGGPPGQGHQPQQGQGQSFSRGPAPNAAGPSSGGGSGQHW